MTGATPPTVSVVIPAFNEARYLGRCLFALERQTAPPHEVIVVDDGSSDGTAAVARRHGSVRVFRQRHRGPAVARNRGAAVATGEILVFVDADEIVTEPFLERLVAPMVERGAIGTFSKERLVANGDRRWARANMLGRNLPPDRHDRPGTWDRSRVFRAVWKRDFDRVGGQDDVGHGQDRTLGRKLGELAHAAPGAKMYHYEPDTLLEIFRSGRWYGRGARIRELPPMPKHRYALRSLRLGAGLALRHRMPSLFVYRVVFDAGVLWGLTTSDPARRGS